MPGHLTPDHLTHWRKQRWHQLLAAACQKRPIAEVARELGKSRTTISLLLSGRYDGKPDKVAALILAAFGEGIACPHLGRDLRKAECEAYQTRSMPTSDAAALRHWIACRSGCPHSGSTLETDDFFEGEINHANQA